MLPAAVSNYSVAGQCTAAALSSVLARSFELAATLSFGGSPAIKCPRTARHGARETAFYVDPTLDTTPGCRARLALFTRLKRLLRFAQCDLY